jgi:hypothetical protein
MKFHCKTWDGLYSFSNSTKHVIGNHYPFRLLDEFGVLFTASTSNALKSDEELFFKKAISRINDKSELSYVIRFVKPVKVVYGEKNEKLKLFHGLFYNDKIDLCTELTFMVLNGKIYDMLNNVVGLIPEGFVYFGIEIPKEILRKAIVNKSILVSVDMPNYEYKPCATTIFIKSLDDLVRYYYKTEEKNGQDGKSDKH